MKTNEADTCSVRRMQSSTCVNPLLGSEDAPKDKPILTHRQGLPIWLDG